MLIISAKTPARGTKDDGLEAFPGVSVGQALLRMLREPRKYLLPRWNWKSAVLSSLFRAGIFFAANLTAGWPAATAAMATELLCGGMASGFYGALTEGFREAEPAWAAAMAAMVVLPLAGHSTEFVVHWLSKTHNLTPSMLNSVLFTVISTLFNLYAMRRGALLVSTGGASLREDMRRMPGLIVDFVLVLPRQLWPGSGRIIGKQQSGERRVFLGREEGEL